jgi:hypothetical protein
MDVGIIVTVGTSVASAVVAITLAVWAGRQRTDEA